MKTNVASVSSITAALLAAIGKQDGTPQALQQLLSGRLSGLNVIPLEDDELPGELQPVARQFRQIPTIGAYDGPRALLIRGGRNLKVDGPKAGPCYGAWEALKSVSLRNDVPTKDAIAFWTPRLVDGSVAKTPDEQRALLTSIREGLELPGDFLSSFGDASLLTQLILGHHGLTGERTPLNGLWARTDTFGAGGRRLGLGGFHAGGLDCGVWGGGGRYDGLGVFPLGVVELGH